MLYTDFQDKKISCKYSGFTLIEALIALVVLSVGLLGVASLQLSSLQSTHYSYQATVANLAAKDVRERLWAYFVNFGECPDLDLNPEAIDVTNWEERNDVTDMLVGLVGVSDCEYSIAVSWESPRFSSRGDGRVFFNYHVKLPFFADDET